MIFTEQEKVRGQVRLTVLSILLDCYFDINQRRPFCGAAGRSITQRKPMYDLVESWYS